MAEGCLTDITFAEIRNLVEADGDPRLIDGVDQFLGAAIVVGAAVSGASGILALLGVKNELVKTGRALVRKLARRSEEDFVGRYERMAAADVLLVYTAFFSAADEVLELVPSKPSMSTGERRALVHRSAEHLSNQRVASRGSDRAVATGRATPSLPHPAQSLDDRCGELGELYGRLTGGLRRFVSGLDALEFATRKVRDRVSEAFEAMPARALAEYAAQYFALAADYRTS
jgi:hypothetical protein